MSETPTPRTDELMDSWRQSEIRYGWKKAIINHARELERELATTEAALSAAEQRAEAMGRDAARFAYWADNAAGEFVYDATDHDYLKFEPKSPVRWASIDLIRNAIDAAIASGAGELGNG